MKEKFFASAFTFGETLIRINAELNYMQEVKPVVALTGTYPTILLNCRILRTLLVWVIQSTWMKEIFISGAGMPDNIRFKTIKQVADWLVFLIIDFWIRNGFLNVLNKAARYYGIEGLDPF